MDVVKFDFSGVANGDFKILDEGTQVLQILDAKYYDEYITKAGKSMHNVVNLKLISKDGIVHQEWVRLTKDGEVNKKAVSNIAKFVACAMNDMEIYKANVFYPDSLTDILDKFIQVDIAHDEYKGKITARMAWWSYAPANDFDSKDELDEL